MAYPGKLICGRGDYERYADLIYSIRDTIILWLTSGLTLIN